MNDKKIEEVAFSDASAMHIDQRTSYKKEAILGNTLRTRKSCTIDGSVECCAPPPRWCDLDL